MSAATESPPATLTAVDLAGLFGPMPLARFRFVPFPGTATEADVVDIHRRERRLCELVHGILVEKAVGYRESFLACALGAILRSFCLKEDLGAVAGESGMMRLAPGLVRIPDVCFIRWDQFPGRRIPDTPIPNLFPDLAVEVLSPSNTAEEMRQKLKDYFQAGTRLVWFVDPTPRTVTVYTSPADSRTLTENDTLDGGVVLPGFSLSLKEFFAELDPH